MFDTVYLFIAKLFGIKKEKALFWKYALPKKFFSQKYESKKIIMLRLDLIGDCAMFTDAAIAIREHYKNHEITMVCLALSRPVFERLGIFDEILSIDFKPESINWKKLSSFIKKLRSKEYDILLSPQVSKYPLADILAAAVKCNKRIAMKSRAGNSKQKWIDNVQFIYNQVIPYPQGWVSEFDYYGAFVRGIGVTDYRTKRPRLPYNPQKIICTNYYVLYPGASYDQKIWPPERFAELAEYIYHETGMTGVLLGSNKEQLIANKLKNCLNIQTKLSIMDLTGRTSISDVIDILGNAKFVISNDTSGVHIACATNTPSIAIAGGWHFGRFLPYYLEEVHKDDKLPIAVYSKLYCYNCDCDFNLKNKDCWKNIISGEIYPCIDAVSVGKVKKFVTNLMMETL